jgi:hypothetical protein
MEGGSRSTEVRDMSVPTPDRSACPAEPRVPAHEFEPENLTPVPSPPESLDPAAVRCYVEQYEIAYKWRAVADDYGGVREFHVDTSPETAVAGEDAVLVEDDAALAHGRFGEETPRGHFDSPTYPFAYLVTDEAVWRAEGSHREEPPDPRSAGTLLQCFDG